MLHSSRTERLMASLTALLTAVAVISSTWRTLNKPHNWWKSRKLHWVNIDARDAAYKIVLQTLEEQFPKVFDRSTLLFTDEVNLYNQMGPRAWRAERHYKVHKIFDGDVEVEMTLEDHKIGISLQKEEGGTTGRDGKPTQRPTLIFKAQSAAGKHAIERYLIKIIESYDRRRPTLRCLNTWGDWQVVSYAPIRKLEHVALAEDKKDLIVADFDKFLRSEEEYLRISRHYSRGYLFFGPPGTGKTSTAKALADHFQLDVYYLNLADLKSDTNLHAAVSEISPRSLLVLEDIDSIHAATDREQDSQKITTTGLLNALDGLLTPHGLITIITTNKRELLDDALIREGRVDLEVEFQVATADQLIEMWNSTVGGEIPVDLSKYVGRAPAAFMDVISNAIDGVRM